MKLNSLLESVRSTDDALKVLSLGRGYSEDELKKAYRAAAMKNHPDRGGSHEVMKDVNAAFELLSRRVGQTDASDFIKQTDFDIKQSGTFKGGKGSFSTSDDWEEAMIKAGREEQLKNIRAHQAKVGGEWEMPGERLNRLADESGLLPEMSIAISALGISDFEFVRPHYIKLHKPLPYSMPEDAGIQKSNGGEGDWKWVPKDIGEIGQKLESNGILKVTGVQKPYGKSDPDWKIDVKIVEKFDAHDFSDDEYEEYPAAEFTINYNEAELKLMTMGHDSERIGKYMKSLK